MNPTSLTPATQEEEEPPFEMVFPTLHNAQSLLDYIAHLKSPYMRRDGSRVDLAAIQLISYTMLRISYILHPEQEGDPFRGSYTLARLDSQLGSYLKESKLPVQGDINQDILNHLLKIAVIRDQMNK